MASFQVVVSDPETGNTYQREAADQSANRFIGRGLGQEVDGGAIGLDDYTRDRSRPRDQRSRRADQRQDRRDGLPVDR
jgi:small subunit ribosomal protein S6e